jgi:hypothetical protein
MNTHLSGCSEHLEEHTAAERQIFDERRVRETSAEVEQAPASTHKIGLGFTNFGQHG